MQNFDTKFSGLSLPTFRTLVDSPLVIHTSARISRTLRFSTGGTGTYFTNPNQVQKFSVNKEDTKNVYESFGKFYQVQLIFVELELINPSSPH